MSTARPAMPTDLGRVSRTAVCAFAHDPLIRWFFPDDAQYVAGASAAFGQIARRSVGLGSAFTTDDGVAVALFIGPGRPEVAAPPAGEVSAAAPPDEELQARFSALRSVMAEHTPPGPHWYLNVLATHPDWQRQGLGGAVMAPIFERCTIEGLPLYLETQTPENVAYYSHHGFQVRSEWDVPLGGPRMWGMLRDP